jgi:transketolase
MIACKTKISKGAGPKEGDPHSHGYALFDAEIAAAREAMGWPYPPFELPEDVVKAWRAAGRRGGKTRRAWAERLKASPHAAEFERAVVKGDLPKDAFAPLEAHIAKMIETKPANATRAHSGAALEALVPAIPEMVGGSADLTGSNNTQVKGMADFDAPASASSPWRRR